MRGNGKGGVTIPLKPSTSSQNISDNISELSRAHPEWSRDRIIAAAHNVKPKKPPSPAKHPATGRFMSPDQVAEYNRQQQFLRERGHPTVFDN